jgi:hypothetical protein
MMSRISAALNISMRSLKAPIQQYSRSKGDINAPRPQKIIVKVATRRILVCVLHTTLNGTNICNAYN